MEYYSAIIKNGIIPFGAMRMDQSEVREKQVSYDTAYIWNLKNIYMIQMNLFTK